MEDRPAHPDARFQQVSRTCYPVLLSGAAAGGTGLNLTGASDVIITKLKFPDAQARQDKSFLELIGSDIRYVRRSRLRTTSSRRARQEEGPSPDTHAHVLGWPPLVYALLPHRQRPGSRCPEGIVAEIFELDQFQKQHGSEGAGVDLE